MPSASSTGSNMENGLFTSSLTALSGMKTTAPDIPDSGSELRRNVPMFFIDTLSPSARPSSIVAKNPRRKRRAVLVSVPVTLATRVISSERFTMLFIGGGV